MKTFITFSPQQEKLDPFCYIPQDAPKLEYGDTKFPIIPVINGYTEPGEEIRMIMIVQDHPHCQKNRDLFVEEFEDLCTRKQLVCAGLEEIVVPYDDAITTHIATFQKLIDHINDDDDLHACITYGSKPSPMVTLMALRYARMIKKNTFVSCIVYGQVNFRTGEAKLYDETALAHLDNIMQLLAANHDPNPKEKLDQIINM